ncbi:MAG: hypothetical protein HDS66_10145 [Bacteroidales bacterium]|nr:hypothetical protein [Bacteroidales bacterium]
MKILKIFLALVATCLLSSCAVSDTMANNNEAANGTVVAASGETNVFEGEPLTANTKFDAVSVFNGIDLYFTASDKIQYKIEASQKVLPYVKVKVDGSELLVYIDKGKSKVKIDENVVVRVSGPVPAKISAFNTSSFVCGAPLVMKNLEVQCWNEASVKLVGKVDVNKASVEAYNNGEVSIGGVVRATSLTLSSWNKGAIKLSQKANVGKANLTAWNDGTVSVPKAEAAQANGEAYNNGRIVLGGKFGSCNIDTFNGGKVEHAGLKVQKGDNYLPPL